MGRDSLVLSSPSIRAKAMLRIADAPDWTRLTFQGPRRTNDQNAKMWSMLGDIAEQHEHFGRKYPKETWKCVFLHALGKEAEFVPSIDGNEMVAIGQSSSDLSISEMSDLFELIHAFAAERGIVLREPDNPAEKRARDAQQTFEPARVASGRPEGDPSGEGRGASSRGVPANAIKGG